jgi:hypothetical protein
VRRLVCTENRHANSETATESMMRTMTIVLVPEVDMNPCRLALGDFLSWSNDNAD